MMARSRCLAAALAVAATASWLAAPGARANDPCAHLAIEARQRPLAVDDFANAVLLGFGGGATGIFFVKLGSGETVAVKFLPQLDVSLIGARRLLTKLGIPHDPLRGDFKIFGVEELIRHLRDSAAAGRYAPGADRQLLTGKLQALGAQVKPAHAVATLFVSLEGTGSFGGALAPDPRRATSAQAQATAVYNLWRAIDALSTPANQIMLGKLVVADALIGNEDRFLKGRDYPFKYDNLVLAAGRDDTAHCLVAIDNEGFAPSIDRVATAYQFAAVPAAFDRVETPQYQLTAAIYLKAMVDGYDDRLVTRASVGPARLLFGHRYSIQPGASPLGPVTASCVAAPGAGSSAGGYRVDADLAAHFRRQLLLAIVSGSKAIAGSGFPLTKATSELELAKAGEPLPATLDPRTEWQRVCESHGKLRFQVINAPEEHTWSIDWALFETNLLIGAHRAIDTIVGSRNLAIEITKDLEGYSGGMFTAKGIELRQRYFAEFVRHQDAAQIDQALLRALRAGIVAQRKKTVFEQDAAGFWHARD